ncbi:RDD family protein [Falsiroseomonas sp.]|uniref:RDD family protein n=1 Tax=Falsiroseomonas sp. TaxID=2870721 RepID=UPI003F6F47D9
MSQQGVELASFGRRLAAQLLDLLWLLPLSVLLGTLGALANGGELSVAGEAMANVIGALVVLIFWVDRQGTPGKLALGLRIVDAETGAPPPFGRLVLRYIGYLLSALPLCLGYLWMLWDPRRQAWHDKMGRTLVVRLPQAAGGR